MSSSELGKIVVGSEARIIGGKIVVVVMIVSRVGKVLFIVRPVSIDLVVIKVSCLDGKTVVK